MQSRMSSSMLMITAAPRCLLHGGGGGGGVNMGAERCPGARQVTPVPSSPPPF